VNAPDAILADMGVSTSHPLAFVVVATYLVMWVDFRFTGVWWAKCRYRRDMGYDLFIQRAGDQDGGTSGPGHSRAISTVRKRLPLVRRFRTYRCNALSEATGHKRS
jgi:hypothetical protein